MHYDALSRLLALCIGLGWSVTAWAAATDAVDLAGLPWLQIALGIALAIWGGLASTAQRLVASVRAGAEPVPVWPGVLADILASSGAGFLVYGIGAWQAWDRSLVSVLLFLGGYGGTRLLEPAASVLSEHLADLLRRIGGGGKDPGPDR